MHSKSINIAINTSYTQSGAPGLGGTGFRQVPHFATGGILPGYSPGHDMIPAMLSPGEGVLTPQAVRTLGTANLASLNAGGGSSATRGGSTSGNSPGVVHVEATIPVTVMLDSKQLFTAIQTQSWRWSLRNTGKPGSWTPS